MRCTGGFVLEDNADLIATRFTKSEALILRNHTVKHKLKTTWSGWPARPTTATSAPQHHFTHPPAPRKHLNDKLNQESQRVHHSGKQQPQTSKRPWGTAQVSQLPQEINGAFHVPEKFSQIKPCTGHESKKHFHWNAFGPTLESSSVHLEEYVLNGTIALDCLSYHAAQILELIYRLQLARINAS